ncbi:MAG TPA: aminotransferase class V-fold PLP-dependent enzyme, partial [Deinococcales bacterium]|nr:aminotransferase class V-fold PLP-dependent enzyme [Deinococcales bacterium]
MNEIYLDHAASTPVRPSAAELQLRLQLEQPANPSSVHRAGQRARRVLEAAREQAARALDAASPAEIIFTSGATEALNQLLTGLAARPEFRRFLVSPLEHPAVDVTVRTLKERGVQVEFLEPVNGAITAESLTKAEPGPGDVVVAMLVNNETGVVTGVRHLANVAHRRGALFVCDATQAFGFEPVSVRELHVDAAVFSGHKFGGPRGTGLLWLRDGLDL